MPAPAPSRASVAWRVRAADKHNSKGRDGRARRPPIRPRLASEEALRQYVFDRRDDYEPLIDLPTRTKEIVRNNNCGQRRAPSAPRSPKRPAS